MTSLHTCDNTHLTSQIYSLFSFTMNWNDVTSSTRNRSLVRPTILAYILNRSINLYYRCLLWRVPPLLASPPCSSHNENIKKIWALNHYIMTVNRLHLFPETLFNSITDGGGIRTAGQKRPSIGEAKNNLRK